MTLDEAIDIVVTLHGHRLDSMPRGPSRTALTAAMKLIAVDVLEQLADADELTGTDLRDALGVGPRSGLRELPRAASLRLVRRGVA